MVSPVHDAVIAESAPNRSAAVAVGFRPAHTYAPPAPHLRIHGAARQAPRPEPQQRQTLMLAAMTEAAKIEGEPCQCAPCLARAQKPTVRAWRKISELDLTRPPAPVLRWALLVALGLCCWGAGLPLNIKDWLGPIIIAGALILPDVAGFGIAGLRLDLKQTQDELAALRLRVDMRQIQAGELHFHGEEAVQRVLGRSVAAEIGERAAKGGQVTVVDDGAEKDVAS
jgi:hypothetical protein